MKAAAITQALLNFRAEFTPTVDQVAKKLANMKLLPGVRAAGLTLPNYTGTKVQGHAHDLEVYTMHMSHEEAARIMTSACAHTENGPYHHAHGNGFVHSRNLTPEDAICKYQAAVADRPVFTCSFCWELWPESALQPVENAIDMPEEWQATFIPSTKAVDHATMWNEVQRITRDVLWKSEGLQTREQREAEAEAAWTASPQQKQSHLNTTVPSTSAKVPLRALCAFVRVCCSFASLCLSALLRLFCVFVFSICLSCQRLRLLV